MGVFALARKAKQASPLTQNYVSLIDDKLFEDEILSVMSEPDLTVCRSALHFRPSYIPLRLV